MAALSTALLSAILGLCMYVGTSQPMIRREDEEGVAVHLSSSGEMVKDRQRHIQQTGLTHARVFPHGSLNELNDIGDTCDDFPLGRANSSNCSGHHQHVPIERLSQCKEAANKAGAYHLQALDFEIPAEWQDTRPAGCFMTRCDHGTGTDRIVDDICYFFNPIGDTPRNPVGVPVCVRPKFLTGTKNTNGAGTDCPAGYEIVLGEGHCKESRCTGIGSKPSFDRVAESNHSKHDEYPQGCFKSEIDKELYYNAPIAGYGLPKAPVGIPMCTVSQVTKCSKTTALACEEATNPELNEDHAKQGAELTNDEIGAANTTA